MEGNYDLISAAQARAICDTKIKNEVKSMDDRIRSILNGPLYHNKEFQMKIDKPLNIKLVYILEDKGYKVKQLTDNIVSISWKDAKEE